ncbi:hypothetical protein D3C81_2035860 [compost metagenome]
MRQLDGCRRQLRPDRQVREKQIGRVDTFRTAYLQQGAIVGKQAHRLMRRTGQQFFQVFEQGLIGMRYGLHAAVVQL